MLQIDTLPPYAAPVDTSSDSITAVCAYDTIFTPMGPVEPVLHRSLFTHHLLPVQTGHETTIQHQGSPGWLFVVIVLATALISLFLHHKQIHLVELLQSAIDHRAMDRMLRDANLTHNVDQAPIAPLMLIPVSLVCFYSFVPQTSNLWTNILQYLIVLVACLAVYYARNGIIRFLGNAFENPEAVHTYLSSNYIYHLLYGIAATALAFFVFYTDQVGQTFLYILFGILALLFLMRFLRGMQLILTNSKTQKFYLFYYLCILEIVPIIIAAKVVINS